MVDLRSCFLFFGGGDTNCRGGTCPLGPPLDPPLPLREKLYGDLAALKKTASFVRAAGVDIQKKRSRKKKKLIREER